MTSHAKLLAPQRKKGKGGKGRIDLEASKTRDLHVRNRPLSHRRVGMMKKYDGCFYVNFIYKKEINVQV